VADIEHVERQADINRRAGLPLQIAETEIRTVEAFSYRRVADETELRNSCRNHIVHLLVLRIGIGEAPELLDDEWVRRALNRQEAEAANVAADDPCDRGEVLFRSRAVTHESGDHAG